jgi:acetyl esterase/lipase
VASSRIGCKAARGLVAIVSAGLASLIYLPAPSHKLALLAVVASEKSWVLTLVGLGTLALTWPLWRSAHVEAGALAGLGLLTVGLSLGPMVEVIAVGKERGVRLDFARHLAAPVDYGIGQAPHTLRYATVAGRPLEVDVYPAANAGVPPRRAIIVVHGGGWSAGQKGETSRFSAWLASLGHHVFDIEYRLVPAARWQAITGDVKCAVGWVANQRALTLGNRTIAVAPGRLTLLGRSAGGHLALFAAFTTDDPTLPPSCPVPEAAVDSVISFYGPTDLVWGYAHPTRPAVFDSSARLRGLLGGPPESVGDAYERASPALRIPPHPPAVLMLHGGRDQFVSPYHMTKLAEGLRAVGGRVDEVFLPYAQHGFDYVFGSAGEQIAEAAVVKLLAEVDRGAGVRGE